MNNKKINILSKILAVLSLLGGILLSFASLGNMLSHLLNITHADAYNKTDSLGENLGLVALRFVLLYVGILIACTGFLVLKGQDKKASAKTPFLQTLMSPKSLYYTNIVMAFLMGIISLFITITQFTGDISAYDFVYGILFLIITVYSFKSAVSLFSNRYDIPESKAILKNIILMPFRPRSILLVGSLILMFVGFLTGQDEHVWGIGELDGIVFLFLGAFLFTRVKYFCKVCGRKMSQVESSYRGREYENFQIHVEDSKIWIEGDVSDDYDYVYWCSHCKSYERVISKRKTNRVKIGD